MQTVQRNFVRSLNASCLSPKRQFEEVKKFTKKVPIVEKFHNCTVEHVDLALEVVDGKRMALVAVKMINSEGKVSYAVGEEVLK